MVATVASKYIAEQPADERPLLEKLDAIITAALPDATVAIKWGVPVYAKGGRNVCALASFKEAVAVNFFAPPRILPDPGKKLEGSGTTSRMLKVRTAKDIDRASMMRWVKAAAEPRS
jgi:hypothetical protein